MVDEYRVLIRRNGFSAFLFHANKGDKEIFIKNITAIELKEPGVTKGYIQFSVQGEIASHGNIVDAITDENSVIIGNLRQYQDFLVAKKLIESKIYNYNNSNTFISNKFSYADELRKLSSLKDDKIITEDEYEEQKSKILKQEEPLFINKTEPSKFEDSIKDLYNKPGRIYVRKSNSEVNLYIIAGVILAFACFIQLFVFLSEKDKSPTTNTTKPFYKKVNIFNDSNKLRERLSENELGKLSNWEYVSSSYISQSKVYETDSPTNTDEDSNVITYYLESKDTSTVEKIRLVLIINNIKGKAIALKRLSSLTNKTFIAMSQNMPNGLINAISKSEEFNFENDTIKIALSIEKRETYSLEVIIESK